MIVWAGAKNANAPLVALHNRFHAQKMTPNATAMIEAITMSIVRQRWVSMCASQRCTGRRRTPCPRMRTGRGWRRPSSLRWHYPDQVRGSVGDGHPHSQRCALPCRIAYVSMTLAPGGRSQQRGRRHMEIKARGFTFDVYESGPADGKPVLLLHGFPQDHREFDRIVPRLHAAGLRTYALDQRGYSAGARPEPVADYKLSEPAADAVAVLDALGLDSAHVIGHDWGAHVGWLLAAHHPDRVRTLTAVSVPHPRALRLALRARPSQRARFAYMGVFRAPWAERLLLAADGL